MAAAATPVTIARSGPGALCAEAQADGVPCAQLAVPCEECVDARPEPRTGTTDAPPPRPGLPIRGFHA
jgi:hypothetical protein